MTISRSFRGVGGYLSAKSDAVLFGQAENFMYFCGYRYE